MPIMKQNYNIMKSLCISLFTILIFAIIIVSDVKAQNLRYFTQPAGVAGSQTPYGDNKSAGEYIQSGDAKIYYETYGSGQPIFIFHGGGVGSPYELGQIIDELRKNYKVVVISSRGHGHSEIGHSPVSLKQKAADMYAVIKKTTDKPAPVLGFSDGAYTAYMLAATHPEAVEKLVAIGAGTLKPEFFPNSMPVSELEKQDQAYVSQMRSLMPEPERLQEFLNDYMSFWNKAEIGADLLIKVECPVLLLGGDRDSHAPPATVLEAAKSIPNSRLCIVPGAGHAAFQDNFPVAWTAINQFLEK
ncbi:MAG: alpha/beta hydrolase [Desulfovibrio sp.]|nr:alpha/beta hydrolase [Desulfovibrio sp.]